VGWNVENVDINSRTVALIKVAQPKIIQKKKVEEKKQTEFFRQPLRHKRHRRPTLPSKTKIAQARARLRNVERRKMASQTQRVKFPTKSAYEKRLFKPEAKPSKTSD